MFFLDKRQPYRSEAPQMFPFQRGAYPLTLAGLELGQPKVLLTHSTWQYTSRDGIPAAPTTAVAAHPQQEEQFVMLHVTWQQAHWQVGFEDRDLSSFDDPVCVATIGSVLAHPAYQHLPGATVLLSRVYTSRLPTADGCLAATPVQEALASAQPQDALLLHRFGVLLAANDVAHRLWPALPTADVSEQQLAWNLLQVTKW